MLAVDGLSNNFRLGKDHIGPALALLIEAQNFHRELRAIHYLEIDQDSLVREKFLIDFGAIEAGGVEPNGDPGWRCRDGGKVRCR